MINKKIWLSKTFFTTFLLKLQIYTNSLRHNGLNINPDSANIMYDDLKIKITVMIENLFCVYISKIYI